MAGISDVPRAQNYLLPGTHGVRLAVVHELDALRENSLGRAVAARERRSRGQDARGRRGGEHSEVLAACRGVVVFLYWRRAADRRGK